jgi:hypothetical protein
VHGTSVDYRVRRARAAEDSRRENNATPLQTLTEIAAEKNSTILFPLPMELMRGLMGPKDGKD